MEKLKLEWKSNSKTSSKAEEADEVSDVRQSLDLAEEAFKVNDTNVKEIVSEDDKKFKEIWLFGAIWNGHVKPQIMNSKTLWFVDPCLAFMAKLALCMISDYVCMSSKLFLGVIPILYNFCVTSFYNSVCLMFVSCSLKINVLNLACSVRLLLAAYPSQFEWLFYPLIMLDYRPTYLCLWNLRWIKLQVFEIDFWLLDNMNGVDLLDWYIWLIHCWGLSLKHVYLDSECGHLSL